MNFRQARSEYLRLRHAYRSGQIPPDEFEKQVNAMIVHSKGQIWMIGVKTGKWYRRDGKRWVEDIPEIDDDTDVPSTQAGASVKVKHEQKTPFRSVYGKKPHETAKEKSFRHLTIGFSIAFLILLFVFVLAGLMFKGIIPVPSALDSMIGNETLAGKQDTGMGGSNDNGLKKSLSEFLTLPAGVVTSNPGDVSIDGYLYSEPVRGSWLLRDASGETLMVAKNGKIRLYSSVENYDYPGMYSFVDDHTIRFYTDEGNAQAEIWIDAGVLTLVIDDTPLVYDRVE